MDFVPIDLNNPLILLRVYLALLWAVMALYGLRVVWRLPSKSGLRPLGIYSVFAALTGAVSYFLGAVTVFHSRVAFLWVALLLTFTPISLILWLNYAKAVSKGDE